MSGIAALYPIKRVWAFMAILFKYTNRLSSLPRHMRAVCFIFIQTFLLFFSRPRTSHMNLLNEKHRKEENEAFNKDTIVQPSGIERHTTKYLFPYKPHITSSFLSTTIFIRVNEILYLQPSPLYVACMSFKDECWFLTVDAVLINRSSHVATKFVSLLFDLENEHST